MANLKQGEIALNSEFKLNLVAFLVRQMNEEWAIKHKGQFVCFVNGMCVDYSDDRSALQKRMLQNFPDSYKFMQQVGVEEVTEDVPFQSIPAEVT